MSQPDSVRDKGSMDPLVVESIAKVSISQHQVIQQDSSTLPSLAQIIFGSTCSYSRQSNVEISLAERAAIEKSNNSEQKSRKRAALNELSRQMTLSIDDMPFKDGKYFDFIVVEELSALPQRTLMMAKSHIQIYANQQPTLIDSKYQIRKVKLFACLLLAALELKELNLQELQGFSEQNIFQFSEKQMVKYIANLTEQIGMAVESNKYSKESIWLELESKLKDPKNRLLRRKFISLKNVQKKYAIQFQQANLGQSFEENERLQQYSFIKEIFVPGPINTNKVENEILAEYQITTNDKENSSIRLRGYEKWAQEEHTLTSFLKSEKNYTHTPDDTIFHSQALKNELTECISTKVVSQYNIYALEVLGKATESIISKAEDEISNATEGFVTELQISLDETAQRRQEMELFKSSRFNGFQEEESIANISSIF